MYFLINVEHMLINCDETISNLNQSGKLPFIQKKKINLPLMYIVFLIENEVWCC